MQREAFTWLWQVGARYNVLRKCRGGLIGYGGLNWYDWVHNAGEVLTTGFLAHYVWETRETMATPADGYLRGFLSTNFFLRWVRIMYMLRSHPKVGPNIVCLLKSFLPMWEMMLVAFVLFGGFGIACLLLNDGDVENSNIIINLFKALLLGDGDAFNKVRDLKGGDEDGGFVSMLVVIASIAFAVCVLNLFTAIYSNEYNQKVEVSAELFFKERANMCFECLLLPPWPVFFELSKKQSEKWAKMAEKRWPKTRMIKDLKVHRLLVDLELRLGAAVGAAVLLALAVFWTFLDDDPNPYLAATALAALELGMQALSLRCEWRRRDMLDRFYLWICCAKRAFGDKESLGHAGHASSVPNSARRDQQAPEEIGSPDDGNHVVDDELLQSVRKLQELIGSMTEDVQQMKQR